MQSIMEIFNGKADPAGADTYIAADMVDHQGIPGVDTSGPDGFRRVVELYRTAFPDAYSDVVSLVAEGDEVVARFHMTGTNTGPFMGMPATNKPFDVEGVDIIRVANGK